MRVFAGSEFMSKKQNPFMSSDVENVVEVISDNICRLIEDFDFTTPSRASKVMTGTSTNGWVVWKTSEGRTLDEIVRKK